MGHACSRRHWTCSPLRGATGRLLRFTSGLVVGLAATCHVSGAVTARSPSDSLEIHPSTTGNIGAFLFTRGVTSAPIPDRATLGTTHRGPLDLRRIFGNDTREGTAFVDVRLATPLDGALLIGASDAFEASIDGAAIYRRDGAHPFREDDEIVAIRLGAGIHRIRVVLRRSNGDWRFHLRLVDERLLAPEGCTVSLPGIGGGASDELRAKLVDVHLHRGIEPEGYFVWADVSFPEGSPFAPSEAPPPAFVWTESSTGSDAVPGTSTVASFDGGSTGQGRRIWLRIPASRIESTDVRGLTAGETVALRIGPGTWRVQIRPSRDLRIALDRHEPKSSSDTPIDAHHAADLDLIHDTLAYTREHLRQLFDTAEDDRVPLRDETSHLATLLDDLDSGRDPLRAHAGIQRFAYRSSLDGSLQPFALYIPSHYRPTGDRRYPLVLALHGLNGGPVSMVQWFLGGDDPSHSVEWEENHLGRIDDIEGFVVAPDAFGNSMYREQGEIDVMTVLDRIERIFPVDPDRVSITGLSMGGTGAASIAFRHPDTFAALEPLCGYQSYFVRNDFAGRTLFPWERPLAEHRSPALWAENGSRIPMFVWYGLRDLPTRNSTVLIDRYRALGYAVEEEHPDVGHEVWRLAYADRKGWTWLSKHTRVSHPTSVKFKTDSLRFNRNAWLQVDGMTHPFQFATVDATWTGPGRAVVSTSNVSALSIHRDDRQGGTNGSVRLNLDGTPLDFAPDEPLAAHREGSRWQQGPRTPIPGRKHPGMSGPLRDIFYEPLVFVYGTQDPAQTEANREAIARWRAIRPGTHVDYPVLPDTLVDADLERTHSLFLFGNARSNRVVAALEPHLPFAIDGQQIVGAGVRWSGSEAGVAFIHPNPRAPDRYVAVVEGIDALGTLRSTSLPELIGDWIVYDRNIAGAKGGMIFADSPPLAGGFFNDDWSLPLR